MGWGGMGCWQGGFHCHFCAKKTTSVEVEVLLLCFHSVGHLGFYL